MRRISKILISVFFIMLGYCGYYFVLPAILNLSLKKIPIQQILTEKSGMNINLENLNVKMGYLPSLWIAADSVKIVNDDGADALNIQKLNTNIDLIPLIVRKINVNKFFADKIDVNLVYDKNSNLKLGQYMIIPPKKNSLSLNKLSLNLNDYNIYLDDQKQIKNLMLDGKYLQINDFVSNKKISLSTDADLVTGKQISKINADVNLKLSQLSDNSAEINGYIVNLDLSDFSEYFKNFLELEEVSGIINLSVKTDKYHDKHKRIDMFLSVKDLNILNKNPKKSIYSKEKIEINSDIKTIDNGIEISEMTLKGDGISSFMSGKITRLDAKMPNLDLNIGVNKSKAENIVNLLPPVANISPDMNFLVLKQAGFWGDVSANLNIKGKADYPNVFGNVLISNAYLVKPIENAEKATIKLAFLGDKMNLNVKVPTSPIQTVWVKGLINLDKERTADLHITSTDSVDLKTAQIVLNPLHEIFGFELGPVPIMDINGKGGINFHVIGSKKNPHGWGQFKFHDAVVSFLDINNLKIQNGSGTLNFDNQNAVFQTKTATLDGKPISIKGTCTLAGDLNFDVSANNQNLSKLLGTIKTSPLLIDVKKLVEPIESVNGNANLKLNITGQVKDINDIEFNKNIFAKGSIELLSNSVKFTNLPVKISKTSGLINFQNKDAEFKLKSVLQNSKLNIDGKMLDNNLNLKVVSSKFNLGDAISALSLKIPYANDLATVNTSFTAKYNGKLSNIEYDKIDVKGKIYSNQDSKSNIIVNNSDFELNGANFKLPMLKGTIKGSPYSLTLNVTKPFSEKRSVNGNGKISSFDLNFINDKDIENVIPAKQKEILKDIEFAEGKIDLSARAWNNNYNIYSVVDNIKFKHKPNDIWINLKSGSLLLHNNTLNLNKINAQLGKSPIFADGKIYNILKKPNLNMYVNLKLTQDLFDQIYNRKEIYPVKLKGDVILASKLSGQIDNINAKSVLNISENSSLYYMGATIGDSENSVKITVDLNCLPNKIKINDLQYDKIILSQNNKPFVKTQLNSSGMLTLLQDNNVAFNNFKIKTQNPTDAKIFNIIFRKPFMKQGVFTSDLIMNGTTLNPKINGKLDITSIEIPFFDSAIRDINLYFKNDKINITSKGTVLANDVKLEAVMKNQLIPPYVVENLILKLATLNINKITDAIREIEVETARTKTIQQAAQPFDISQLIINNSDISAKKIKVRNIDANNFSANMKITPQHIIDVDKFKFNVAQGVVLGNFVYDSNNNKTNLKITLNDANALVMSEALFDLKGQVYGSIDGDFNLSCIGNSNDDCFRTLSGEGNFKIADGRMPKLGSLEYLLKAGNLFKSGITGLSINSLVDLVTPLKTGDFEKIYGDIHIENGVADNINVYSSGNDLNMYMSGSYNILSSVADMKIFGSLSKNITTVFGKIKNASLNTLFNTIPGVNDSKEKLLLQSEISKIPNINDVTDIYRIFAVDVNGDINGTDYVRSFRWVK